jgi:cytochrome c oxidase assembly protein subunit 15
LALTATASNDRIDAAGDRLRPVRVWLYCVAAMVLAMVVIGGATRLTESGLSITEWAPISGMVPPLTDADWLREFDAYKLIPQYLSDNSWMGMDDFKYIFWWEWSHRFFGRIIGFAFLVPFLVFLVQRRFSWSLAGPLAGLFVLGGFQGFLGWWMVSSGLSQLTSVSQYRLAAHLFAASILFLSLIWVARRLVPRRSRDSAPGAGQGPGWPVWLLLALILFQIVAGAFVAGLDAGMGYNTWPLMDGSLVPAGLGAMQPLWRNLFENAMTVQFDHRMIAYAIVVYVGVLIWWQRRRGGFSGVNGWLPRIGALVLLQVGLGIATLLSVVAIPLALGHQALAFMLAGAVMAYLADATPRRSAGRTPAISAA